MENPISAYLEEKKGEAQKFLAVMKAKNEWKKFGIEPDPAMSLRFKKEYFDNGTNPQVSLNNFDADNDTMAQIYFAYSPGRKSDVSAIEDKKIPEVIRLSRKISSTEVGQGPITATVYIENGKPVFLIDVDSGNSKEFSPTSETFFEDIRKAFSEEPRILGVIPESGSIDLVATLKAFSNPKIDRTNTASLFPFVPKK